MPENDGFVPFYKSTGQVRYRSRGSGKARYNRKKRDRQYELNRRTKENQQRFRRLLDVIENE